MVGATDPCADPITPRAVARVLEHIGEAYVAVDARWRFTYVNGQAERIYKLPREYLLGNTLWQMYPSALGTEFERVYRKAMRERIECQLEAAFPKLEGWFGVKVYPLDNGGLAFYFSDITERRRAAKHLDCQKQILDLVYAGASLNRQLSVITSTLQEISVHPLLASILLADMDSGILRLGTAPDGFRRGCSRFAIAAELGPCATAALSRKTVLVENIQDHPSAGFRQFAQDRGLCAAWATPILVPEGAVLGTLALYYRECVRPSPQQEESAHLMASLAARLIQQHQAKAARADAAEPLLDIAGREPSLA